MKGQSADSMNGTEIKLERDNRAFQFLIVRSVNKFSFREGSDVLVQKDFDSSESLKCRCGISSLSHFHGKTLPSSTNSDIGKPSSVRQIRGHPHRETG